MENVSLLDSRRFSVGHLKTGDRIRFRHTNGSFYEGKLHEVSVIGMVVKVPAYRDTEFKRFYPWVQVEYVEEGSI